MAEHPRVMERSRGHQEPIVGGENPGPWLGLGGKVVVTT
jgi:hypothetical protein